MANESYLARVRAAPKYYLSGLYEEISTKNVFLFAQAIAFKVLVTIVPILILATGITGEVLEPVLRGANAFERIREILTTFLPAYESEQILTFLQQLLDASPALTLIGAIGLILAAMTLMTTVRIAVAGAFEQDWHEPRTIVGGYAFDLRMVGQVGLFFVLTIVLTIAAQVLSTEGQALLQWLGLGSGWVSVGWQRAFRLVGVLLPFLVTAAMFFQLFYFIPVPHPPKRSAAVGTLVAAILWEAAKFSFTLYAEYVGQFDRYVTSAAPGGGMSALGSSFGLLIAFVFWIYYSGIVLMLGALVGPLHERQRRIRQHEAAKHARFTLEPGRKLDAAAHEAPVSPETDREAASDGSRDASAPPQPTRARPSESS